MSVIARLEHQSLDPAAELDALVGECGVDGCDGAVVAFTGLARSRSSAGSPVAEIRLDWHSPLTETSLQAIAEAAVSRFDVNAVRVVHRCGRIRPGEPIVFAAASAPHRREAFLAADYLMDRLKSEAAFWKYESGPDGGRWIEPTEQDRATLARWSD